MKRCSCPCCTKRYKALLKRSKSRRKDPRNRLEKFASVIESKSYSSDNWLKNYWDYFKHPEDKFNTPYRFYIPDLINTKFKYIVECDGSIHGTAEQIIKDKKRDDFFKRQGFFVFRVKYMDFAQLDVIKEAVYKLRGGSDFNEIK